MKMPLKTTKTVVQPEQEKPITVPGRGVKIIAATGYEQKVMEGRSNTDIYCREERLTVTTKPDGK